MITKLERLYDEVANDGIKVVSAHFDENIKGACMCDDMRVKAIILDKAAIKSELEEREVLQEEKSHYDTDSLYFIKSGANTPQNRSNRIWAEGRAKRHMVKKLVPIDELKTSFGRFVYPEGLDIYGLAEHFEVTPELAQKAIEQYHTQGERW